MLEIRSLVKIYPGPVTALSGVDLDIPAGMFGLLGPNGAGKTTFMRILAGLLEPTSGTVTLDGHDVVKDPQWLRARLGYLPQEFGFYPHLSGEAMLAHLLALKGVTAARGTRALARDLLERVNLSYAGRRPVRSYSGGMRQRLGIAQAIAGDPRLVIVDEPTAGLDPEERLRFYHLLAELAQDRTVILSTHIVEDVAVLCPRFAVIRAGKLVARTTPREAREAVAGTIFEGTVAPADLPALRAERVVTQALLVEGVHRVRVFAADRRAPAGFDAVAASLEDAYLVLMRTGGEALGLNGGAHGAARAAAGNGSPQAPAPAGSSAGAAPPAPAAEVPA